MLRLFSSIRKTLVNEGKTSRYARYAVGEVLLIMVGILLALQVQTWNEGRKLAQDRRELIENLKADFSVNLRRIEEELEEATRVSENLEKLLRNSGGETTELGVMNFRSSALFNTIRTNEFEPVLGAYRSALSTGMIKLIGDRDLHTYFIEFEGRVERLDDLDRMWVEADYSGLIKDLRARLGTIAVLRGGRNAFIPKNFQVTEEEFYQLIGREEVYAFLETKSSLKSRQRRNLARIKEKTEQILTALEALE